MNIVRNGCILNDTKKIKLRCQQNLAISLVSESIGTILLTVVEGDLTSGLCTENLETHQMLTTRNLFGYERSFSITITQIFEQSNHLQSSK